MKHETQQPGDGRESGQLDVNAIAHADDSLLKESNAPSAGVPDMSPTSVAPDVDETNSATEPVTADASLSNDPPKSGDANSVVGDSVQDLEVRSVAGHNYNAAIAEREGLTGFPPSTVDTETLHYFRTKASGWQDAAEAKPKSWWFRVRRFFSRSWRALKRAGQRITDTPASQLVKTVNAIDKQLATNDESVAAINQKQSNSGAGERPSPPGS